jgi:hypothetical protein
MVSATAFGRRTSGYGFAYAFQDWRIDDVVASTTAAGRPSGPPPSTSGSSHAYQK